MKSFKNFLLEKIDISDISTEAQDIIENVIISKSQSILKSIASQFDKASDSYITKVRLEWGKYITQTIIVENYIRSIRNELKDNLQKHVKERFSTLPTKLTDDARVLFVHKKTSGVGGFFNSGFMNIVVYFDFDALTHSISRDVTESVRDNKSKSIQYNSVHSILNPFIRSIVSTYTHEVSHMFQYLSSQEKKVTNDFPISNYFNKNKESYIKTITTEASSWTNDDWELYLSAPIEIDAHAAGVASTIISMSKQDYGDDPDMELDQLKWLLATIKYETDWNQSSYKAFKVKIYPKIKENPAYYKIWKRFLKKIYEKVQKRIEIVKTKI